MTARQLVEDLRRRGVRVTVADRRLTIRAPQGVLTADDRAALTAHKPTLLGFLTAPCLDCGAPLPPGHLYRCAACTAAAWHRVYRQDPPAQEGAADVD